MSTSPMDSPFVRGFDEVLKSWTDDRIMSRDDIRSLFLFGHYLVNMADHAGWSYDGHSFKVGSPLGTLVIKATLGGAPVVSFISGRTFVNCVKIFLRRLDGDTVEWRADRFRG